MKTAGCPAFIARAGDMEKPASAVRRGWEKRAGNTHENILSQEESIYEKDV